MTAVAERWTQSDKPDTENCIHSRSGRSLQWSSMVDVSVDAICYNRRSIVAVNHRVRQY